MPVVIVAATIELHTLSTVIGLTASMKIAVRDIMACIFGSVRHGTEPEGGQGIGKASDPVYHVGVRVTASCWKSAGQAEDDFAIHIIGVSVVCLGCERCDAEQANRGHRLWSE